MYAKISQVAFKPGNEEEALDFIRTKMFPSASVQSGFKDAFIFQNTHSDPLTPKYTLISIWESKEAMQKSAPPEHLHAGQQRFETLVASFSQEIHEMLFQFSEHSQS